MNGFIAFVAYQDADDPKLTAADLLQDGVRVLFKVGAIATGISVVLAAQGALIGERRSGTAAWILSKPVTRGAFLLSKLLANGFAFLALALLVPSLAFWAQAKLSWGAAPAPSAFTAGVGIWAIHLLFYLSLTLFLGTLFRQRGPVAGIALGTMFAGLPLVDLAPRLARLLPWRLPDTSAMLALGMSPPPDWPVPLGLAALWSVAFLGAALWRFRREEL